MRSSPAQNAFIASDERVRLQCIMVIPYLEVSSKDYLVVRDKRVHLQRDIACSEVMSNRDYLVASTKCVPLQCDIVFKGEMSYI